jgi:probable F420-dependent oxidoreductase
MCAQRAKSIFKKNLGLESRNANLPYKSAVPIKNCDEFKMKLGRLGVFALTDGMTASKSAAFAKRLEDWGYSALWMGDGYGRDVLIQCSWLLANTSKLILASGIASIYGRDAVAMAVSKYTLCEQSGGRFILGIGVSHERIVEGRRGHVYGKPLTTMRNYLDSMDGVEYRAPLPAEAPRAVLAALGPKMLALAGERTDGAMPFCVTPAYTAQARAILGPGKLLCPEQKLLLESDPVKARASARQVLARYFRLDNYRNNRNRCEPNTLIVLAARYAISYARLPRSGAAVVSRGCPEVSDGSDSTGNFAVRVKARQLGERT